MIRGNLPKIEDNTYITAIHNAINKSQLDPGNVASTGYVVSTHVNPIQRRKVILDSL